MRAELIGESSAGMTAVQIYDSNGDLVWSCEWFGGGATTYYYRQGLCDAWDCMYRCADWRDFDGCAEDDDGNPIDFDCAATTGIILEYDSDTDTWTPGDAARHMGQSGEILDACMAAGLIPADADHEEYVDGWHGEMGAETIRIITAHIREVLG